MKHSIEDYKSFSDNSTPVFFDRGLPDLMGYQAIAEGPDWEKMIDKVKKAVDQYRYHTNALILPPWEAIYTQDEERKHSFEEAQKAYGVIKDAYTECGYTLTELPKVSIDERMSFIINWVGSMGQP